jgi:hypothetical protein
MTALRLVDRLDEAISIGHLAEENRVVRAALAWFLVLKGEDPTPQLQRCLEDVDANPRSLHELIRPQHFGAVMIARALEGDGNAVLQRFEQMEKLKLATSACCDRAIIAAYALNGDVGRVREQLSLLDAKLAHLSSHQRGHPEVVWTADDILDGRQYYDFELLKSVFDADSIVARLEPKQTQRALRLLTVLETDRNVHRHIVRLRDALGDNIEQATADLIDMFLERWKEQEIAMRPRGGNNGKTKHHVRAVAGLSRPQATSN